MAFSVIQDVYQEKLAIKMPQSSSQQTKMAESNIAWPVVGEILQLSSDKLMSISELVLSHSVFL